MRAMIVLLFFSQMRFSLRFEFRVKVTTFGVDGFAKWNFYLGSMHDFFNAKILGQ